MTKKIKKIHLLKKKDLTEGFDDCFSEVSEAGIDSTNHLIKDVCLFGTPKSANGRFYTDKAITSIATLAEGSKCYLDHPGKSELKERDGVRSVRDFAGVFQGAYQKGTKVFANLKVREAFFPLLQDIAVMSPKGMGLSINARVKVFSDGAGVESVADVDLLRSTDLVSSAATTQNLWESSPDIPDEEQELNDLSESVEDEVKDKFDTIIVEEGMIQNQLDNQKIRSEIDQVSWLAQDLINKVLMDDKLSVADKKKKVISVFNDLDSEVQKRVKTIKEAMEDEQMDLNKLKADHKDLVTALLDEFKQAEEYKLLQSNLDKATKDIEDLKLQLADNETATKAKETEIEDLKSQNVELKAKLDEVEVSEKLAAKKAIVTKALSEAKLPKEAITDVFTETLMNLEEKKVEDDKVITVEEQIKTHIEDRKALVNKDSGKIRNSGDEFIDKITESVSDEDKPEKKTTKEASESFLGDLK